MSAHESILLSRLLLSDERYMRDSTTSEEMPMRDSTTSNESLYLDSTSLSPSLESLVISDQNDESNTLTIISRIRILANTFIRNRHLILMAIGIIFSMFSAAYYCYEIHLFAQNIMTEKAWYNYALLTTPGFLIFTILYVLWKWFSILRVLFRTFVKPPSYNQVFLLQLLHQLDGTYSR